jgi:hypothetical protein
MMPEDGADSLASIDRGLEQAAWAKLFFVFRIRFGRHSEAHPTEDRG